MALGLALTGHFSNLIVFTSIILIHEMGHVFVSRLFKYNVKKIVIYPYGGVTKLDTIINTSIYKDLLVAISGTLMQIIYFGFVCFLYSKGVIREYIYNLFFLYHKSMLIFNLLPIIPLDGFKIFNLITCKFVSFKLSNYISVVISFVTVIIFLFSDLYERNYSLILVIGILMQNIYRFYYDISYIYERFLLERYLYNIRFKDKKVVSNINRMYKNKSHFFVKNGKIMDEKMILSDFFIKNKWFVWLKWKNMLLLYCFEDLELITQPHWKGKSSLWHLKSES